MSKPRDCERQCRGPCGEWKHFSRFRSWKDKRRRNRTVSVQFSPICRDCEQKARNQKRNIDRPRAIIEGRAKSAATKAGESLRFFWMNMNYQSLVPVFRAMMTNEGLCQNCGHTFENERDIQLDHIEPPRSETDWARLHARNIHLFCTSCNSTKSNKKYADWLDEQEGARLSNQEKRNCTASIPLTEMQWALDLQGGSNPRHSTP